MRMSNCGSAKNKIAHPLQCVLTHKTTERCKHSWTVGLAANVTDQAAHKQWQSGSLKKSKMYKDEGFLKAEKQICISVWTHSKKSWPYCEFCNNWLAAQLTKQCCWR